MGCGQFKAAKATDDHQQKAATTNDTITITTTSHSTPPPATATKEAPRPRHHQHRLSHVSFAITNEQSDDDDSVGEAKHAQLKRHRYSLPRVRSAPLFSSFDDRFEDSPPQSPLSSRGSSLTWKHERSRSQTRLLSAAPSKRRLAIGGDSLYDEPAANGGSPKPTAHIADAFATEAVSANPHKRFGLKQWASKERSEIRIFVSSNFRDMFDEREVLMKNVFPHLRSLCHEHGVFLTEVDLRWGTTEDQLARLETLSVCLKEVYLSAPFFVCLLGDRYGWIPDEQHFQRTKEDFEWVDDFQDRSVTELEIMAAFQQQQRLNTLFYFRELSDEYLATLPKKQRDFLTDNDGDKTEEQRQIDRQRMARLKAMIEEQSDTPVRRYQTPQELGELILQDLTTAFNAHFANDEAAMNHLDRFDRENVSHAAFAITHSSLYVRRQSEFDYLDQFAMTAQSNKVLIVSGAAGIGKSALLANWVLAFQDRQDEEHEGSSEVAPLRSDVFLIAHFVGASTDSTDHLKMLQRLTHEIQARFPLDQAVDDSKSTKDSSASKSYYGNAAAVPEPDDPRKITEAFSHVCCHGVPVWAKLCLVIDGANQLIDRDGCYEMRWIPNNLPDNVRFIVSTTADSPIFFALDEQRTEKAGDVEVLYIEPLKVTDREHIIAQSLQKHGKTIAPESLQALAQAEQSANPLFLCEVLQELTAFGSNEKVGDQIQSLLTARTIGDLYSQILRRHEQYFTKHDNNLVRNAFSFLCLSKCGLRENELIDLLNRMGSASETSVTRAMWSPLFLSLQGSLINRGGLLSFFHTQLRDAVEERYLQADPSYETSIRTTLCEYFTEQWKSFSDAPSVKSSSIDAFMLERIVQELPHHYMKLRRKEDLKVFLCDINVAFKWMMGCDLKYDLYTYWRDLIKDGYDPAASYREVVGKVTIADTGVTAVKAAARTIETVASFLHYMGYFDDALTVREHALKILMDHLPESHPDIAVSLNSVSIALKHIGNHTKALEYAQQALAIRQKTLSENHPDIANSINSIAMIYHDMGDYHKSLESFQQAHEIRMRHVGPSKVKISIAASLNNLGMIYAKLGAYDKALECHQQSLEIKRVLLPEVHRDVAGSLSNIALLHSTMGNFTKALENYQQAYEIRKKLFPEHHPIIATSISNISSVYKSMGEFAKALEYGQLALAIRKKSLPENHIDIASSIDTIGSIYESIGDYQRALEHHQESLRMKRQSLPETHPGIASSLRYVGFIYRAMTEYDKALEYVQQAVLIGSKCLAQDHPQLLICEYELGHIYDGLRDYDSALHHCKCSLDGLRKVYLSSLANHPQVAECLDAMSKIYNHKGDPESVDTALEYCQRALEMRQSVFGTYHPNHPDIAASLQRLGEIYRQKGDFPAALEHFKRALELRNMLPESHPRRLTSLENVASAQFSMGHFEEALANYKLLASNLERIIQQQQQGAGSEEDALKHATLLLLPKYYPSYSIVQDRIIECEKQLQPQQQPHRWRRPSTGSAGGVISDTDLEDVLGE